MKIMMMTMTMTMTMMMILWRPVCRVIAGSCLGSTNISPSLYLDISRLKLMIMMMIMMVMIMMVMMMMVIMMLIMIIMMIMIINMMIMMHMTVIVHIMIIMHFTMIMMKGRLTASLAVEICENLCDFLPLNLNMILLYVLKKYFCSFKVTKNIFFCKSLFNHEQSLNGPLKKIMKH